MILLREAERDIEVLMTRRHADLAFMGGLWVFPGGTLTPADHDDAAREVAASASLSFELNDLAGVRLPQDTCFGLAFAACRETFEEAGVLLAARADGLPVELERLARLHSQRAQLAADPTLFVAALRQEGLRLELERMVYWAHWITPSAASRRFDTRFFLARAPQTDAVTADSYETTECAWLSPARLLERAARGAMRLALPTRYNLDVLRASIERHRSLDALLAAEAARTVPPIMPKLIKNDDKSIVVMPWDEGYEALPGEGLRGSGYDRSLLQLPSRAGMDH